MENFKLADQAQLNLEINQNMALKLYIEAPWYVRRELLIFVVLMMTVQCQ